MISYQDVTWTTEDLERLRAWIEHYTNATPRTYVEPEIYEQCQQWSTSSHALEVICAVLATRLEAGFENERQKALDFCRYLSSEAFVALSAPLEGAISIFDPLTGSQPHAQYHAIATWCYNVGQQHELKQKEAQRDEVSMWNASHAYQWNRMGGQQQQSGWWPSGVYVWQMVPVERA